MLLIPLLGQQPFTAPAKELDEEELAQDEMSTEEILAEENSEEVKADLNQKVLEKKYNRRVMLMVFINESRNKNLEYLGISVADAFSVPLVKTGNFVILNRDSVNRYMTTMGIPHDDIYKAENATRLGKAIGADVVVPVAMAGFPLVS